MTWNAVRTNLPGDPPVFALATDPQHTSTVYAGTSFGMAKMMWDANSVTIKNQMRKAWKKAKDQLGL